MGIIHPDAFHVLKDEFTVGSDMLAEVAVSFQKEMVLGLLRTGTSSLRMLKSYIGLPAGNETGEYLALDFGGTNVRVLRIVLEGGGKYNILKKVARPLRVAGAYDCVCAGSTAVQLFDFLAALIDEAVDGNRADTFLLSHTFSFPSSQASLRDEMGGAATLQSAAAFAPQYEMEIRRTLDNVARAFQRAGYAVSWVQELKKKGISALHSLEKGASKIED